MSTSPGRVYHHSDLGSALIGSALELLAEGCAETLSLRAVARRAGVSPMAPYRHFSDKEALLSAVAVRGFENLALALRGADRSTMYGGALVSQTVAYVRFALNNRALFRLMFATKPRGDDALSRASHAAFSVMGQRVEQLNPEPESGLMSIGFQSLAHGIAELFLDGHLLESKPIFEDELTRLVTETMLGLLTEPAPVTPRGSSIRSAP